METMTGILCWNNLNEISKSIPIIKKEEISDLFIVDNGSNEKTIDFLKNNSENNIFLKDNVGISRAKNKLIDIFISEIKYEYFFMIDGDVCPINNSFIEMIDFMEKNKNVGVLGQNIDFWVKDIDDPRIPKKMPSFKNWKITYNRKSGTGTVRSWTHYAIYRRDVFLKNIRFDENGPFGQSGYGFDDDDLGMQINTKGYDIVSFDDIYCFHNCNSSVKPLSESGNLNYNERKEYFYKKWDLARVNLSERE